MTTDNFSDSKGFACYIDFSDASNTITITPKLFNRPTPFIQYTSFNGYNNRMNFVWSDICDFTALINTADEYISLSINFYIRYDVSVTFSNFIWSVGLTRTTINE